jgi:hypothetical protein
MKMHRLLVLVLLHFITVAAFAQTDSLHFRKNEIGADFFPLFKQNRGTSLLYRRHQQNAAWRVRFYGSFRQSSADQNTEDFSREAKARVRLGREWHYDMHKFRFYFGLDLCTDYSSSHNSVQQPEWYELHDRNLEGGILPLLGFGYKINDRFMVSAEANGQLVGGRNWQWSRSRWGKQYSYIDYDALSEFALFMAYQF